MTWPTNLHPPNTDDAGPKNQSGFWAGHYDSAATREANSATSFERAHIGPSPAARALAWASRSVCGPKSTSRGRSDGGACADQATKTLPHSGRRSAQSTSTSRTDEGGGRAAGSSTRMNSRLARAAASAIRLPKRRSRPIRTTVTPTRADLPGGEAAPPVELGPRQAACADARRWAGSDR